MNAAASGVNATECISHVEKDDEMLEVILATAAIKEKEKDHSANHVDSVLHNLLEVDVGTFTPMSNGEVEYILFFSSSDNMREENWINETPMHCISGNIFSIPDINRKGKKVE